MAAHLIYGDLLVIDESCRVVMEHHRWANRYMPFRSALDTWRGSREAFASDVKAWQWALVDGCFSNLVRTIPMIEPGKQISADDMSVLRDLRDAAGRALKVIRAAHGLTTRTGGDRQGTSETASAAVTGREAAAELGCLLPIVCHGPDRFRRG